MPRYINTTSFSHTKNKEKQVVAKNNMLNKIKDRWLQKQKKTINQKGTGL